MSLPIRRAPKIMDELCANIAISHDAINTKMKNSSGRFRPFSVIKISKAGFVEKEVRRANLYAE